MRSIRSKCIGIFAGMVLIFVLLSAVCKESVITSVIYSLGLLLFLRIVYLVKIGFGFHNDELVVFFRNIQARKWGFIFFPCILGLIFYEIVGIGIPMVCIVGIYFLIEVIFTIRIN